MAVARQSAFRDVFGSEGERYEGFRVTNCAFDGQFCAVNPKLLAIAVEPGGSGCFIVIPLSNTGRLPPDYPKVAAHKDYVLALEWNPHNDNMLASASEDGSIRVWDIPDEGFLTNQTDSNALLSLEYHQRRVPFLAWHPTASNVLLSASQEPKIVIWNLDDGEAVVEVDFPDIIFSGSFNIDGSRFCCLCKDKKLRILDTHTGDIIKEASTHEGAKPTNCAYLKNGRIFTTGFSKMSERQYAMWDENDFSKPMVLEQLDTANGSLRIHYDPDISMVYLAAKGDSNIRYYEITEEDPYVHYINTYQTTLSQRGVCSMPKRALDVNHNEVARFCKLYSNKGVGICEVISFTVPRESDLFQDDLYPDTASGEAAITPEEFFAGKNAMPLTISMQQFFKR